MLPDNCRWSDTAEGACLYRNYACIVVVRPGRVEIQRGGALGSRLCAVELAQLPILGGGPGAPAHSPPPPPCCMAASMAASSSDSEKNVSEPASS